MSITINTNLSSLIVQFALKGSTLDLNRAIERMTTGNKINSAKDDAAGYSVMTGMSTKMGAYRIAEGNASAGLDMVSTAVNTLDLMNNQLSRLRSLAVEAQNGTYGAQSLSALKSETKTITDSLNQLMTSAEYNGKKLFSEVEPPVGFNQSNMPEVQESGFIGDITPVDTSSMKTLTQAVADGNTIKGGTWAIGSVEDLVKLAELTNTTTDNTTGTTFVLSKDIDLSSIDNWTPIGDYSADNRYRFAGTFNGNGHVIKNLRVNNPSKAFQGLFGHVASGSSIKNLGVEDVDITGNERVGGLLGSADRSSITSCYSTGTVSGSNYVGGLVGLADYTSISTNYSTVTVSGSNYIGGLVGYTANNSIASCYSLGTANGSCHVGGILGGTYYGSITYSYSTVIVSGSSYVGGLVGDTYYGSITSSYSTGNVEGNHEVGGLIGVANHGTITASYSTGDVAGVSDVGGLVGIFIIPSGSASITNSISYSKVSGQNRTGSVIGNARNTNDGSSFGTLTITNCNALPQNMPAISGCYDNSYTPNTHGYDGMLAGISDTQYRETSLQVGIDGSQYSVITADTGFKKNVLSGLSGLDITRSDAIFTIDKVISDITSKQTELGAVQNRLESVLDSITVQYDNLVSARSVINDADVTKESATYIKSQILQNASAALLATANQSPSLALTLIGGLQRRG